MQHHGLERLITIVAAWFVVHVPLNAGEPLRPGQP